MTMTRHEMSNAMNRALNRAIELEEKIERVREMLDDTDLSTEIMAVLDSKRT